MENTIQFMNKRSRLTTPESLNNPNHIIKHFSSNGKNFEPDQT